MSENPQFLSFPVQKCDPDDCLTDQEAVYQLKLKAAALLNDATAGTYTLTLTNIHSLVGLNELCREVGIPPLDFDLDALMKQ